MDELFAERKRAVELSGEGWSQAAIADELGRSREWVRKWLGRYRASGLGGLGDRSRRPLSHPTQLPEAVVAQVLRARDVLAGHPFANRGPNAIYAFLERDGTIDVLPSVASIKRILSANDLTRPYRKQRRRPPGVLGLPNVTMPGRWQQADWIQDRYLQGGVRFNSLQIADVGSHVMSAGVHPRRTLLAAVHQLTEQAWPTMSIGQAMSIDNAFSKTSHPNNPWTIWIRVMLMFGVEAIISPPYSLGWTNHVEAVNGLLQARTINRHHYATLNDLQAGIDDFCDWANHDRAILNPALCGTRYPAEHVTTHTPTLRWPPNGFTINDYLNANGTPRIPLARGRLTFIRETTADHTIRIAHTHWPVPTSLPQGTITIAGIDTGTGHLTIRHQGEPIARYDYPITPTDLDPYHPPTAHGLLDHLPTMS